MKNLKAIIMIILLGLVGCSNDSLGGLFSNKKELIIIPREDTIKALVTVEDARFSIDIPGLGHRDNRRVCDFWV